MKEYTLLQSSNGWYYIEELEDSVYGGFADLDDLIFFLMALYGWRPVQY